LNEPVQDQNPLTDFMAPLNDRRLLKVTGEDAFDFLQNIITNDMSLLTAQRMIYACLLSPQGQWLHDFFVIPLEDGFVLDVESGGYDDLFRRLTMFKLRAKVVLQADDETRVYAAAETAPVPAGEGIRPYADPRLSALGRRVYARQAVAAANGSLADYEDFCLSLGVPAGRKTIAAGRDVMADVNLDLLHAVAWDKGCFIGQEVAARMHHRNLSKKRLFVLTGDGLEPGAVLHHDAVEAGQIRQVSQDGKQALAVVKIAVLSHSSDRLTTAEGKTVAVHKPAYLS
jgi:folate-binding protein YgfZ